VDDPGGMGAAEGAGDLRRDLQRLVEPQPLARDEFIQRAALDVFHRNEIRALVRCNVVDVHDVRMVQRRSGLCLLHEPRLPLQIDDLVRRQHFERHEAIQMRVARLVHHTHAALAQLFDDLVVQEFLADHRRCAQLGTQLKLKRQPRESKSPLLPGCHRAGWIRQIQIPTAIVTTMPPNNRHAGPASSPQNRPLWPNRSPSAVRDCGGPLKIDRSSRDFLQCGRAA
jgi:hypothetical protein